MDTKKILISLFVIFIMICLSGCEEQGVTTEGQFENVYLDSEIVDLVYANLSFVEKREINDDLEPVMVIKQVNIEYLFENVAGKNISFDVFVEFYDSNDTLISTVRPVPYDISLPKDFTETLLNTASYSGKNVEDVSYARIIVNP